MARIVFVCMHWNFLYEETQPGHTYTDAHPYTIHTITHHTHGIERVLGFIETFRNSSIWIVFVTTANSSFCVSAKLAIAALPLTHHAHKYKYVIHTQIHIIQLHTYAIINKHTDHTHTIHTCHTHMSYTHVIHTCHTHNVMSCTHVIHTHVHNCETPVHI